MAKHPVAKPPSSDDEKPASPVAIGCVRVFFGVFLLAGATLFFSMLIVPLCNLVRAQWWEETPCTIVTSEVKSETDSEGDTTYSVALRYRYRFQGATYTSDRFDFFGHISGGDSRPREAVVAAHPAGSTGTCFVNPSHPAEAVMDRAAKGGLWLGLISIPFLLVGLVVFIPTRLLAKGSAKGGPVTGTWRQIPSGLPAGVTSAPVLGPVDLPPRHTPRVRVIRSVIFCLGWTSVVIVLGFLANNAYQSGHPENILTTFFLIFGFVALLLLGDVVQNIRGLIRPEIRLTINQPGIPLGHTLELQWQLRGHAAKIRHLQLKLHACEEATYSRGSDNLTDTHVFFEKVFADVKERAGIVDGAASVAVPGHLMHSFEARHNRILWSIRLKGHLPNSAMIEERFPVLILPHAAVEAVSRAGGEREGSK